MGVSSWCQAELIIAAEAVANVLAALYRDLACVCVQHFEGYDAEGFSMWMCDYKYNDENTINYVVMNKVRP